MSTLKVQIGANISQLEKSLSTAQSRLQSFGSNLTSIGGTLSTRVTAPLAAFGATTLKTAGDFESSMNKVAAITQATASDLSKLEDVARSLGATTQFSASEAAEGMSFLAMAGFETSEVIGAMPSVLNLAAAAQLDMASSADIASNIMSGFGMTTEELGGAIDVLAKSMTSSNTNLSQLGEAMKMVGPVASGFGVQFEETAAAVGLLSDAGMQASMAGTGLRRVMTILSQEADELGVNVFDSSGEFRSLADIIEDLEKKGLSASKMMEIFGDRGGPAMQVLLSRGSQALREMTGELNNAGGTAQKIAEQQMEGLNGSLKELRSAFEEMQLAIADSGLLDLGVKITESVTSFIRKISQLEEKTLKTFSAIALAIAGIGPVLIAAGVAVKGLALAIGVLTSPVTAVIALIGALGAAVFYLWGNWEALKERISDINWWRNAIIDMIQFLIEQNPFSYLIDGFNMVLEYFGRNPISNIFDDAADSLERFKGETKEYANEFMSFGETVKSVFGIATGLSGSGGSTSSEMVDGIQKTGIAYETSAQKVESAMQKISTSTAQGRAKVTENLSGMATKTFELGGMIQSTINNMATGFVEDLALMATGSQSMGGLVNNILSSLGNLAVQMGKIILTAGLGIEKLKAALSSLNGVVAIAAGAALIAIGTAAKSALSGLGGSAGAQGGAGTGGFERTATSVQAGGQVEFKISGDNLVGVLQNNNRSTSRVGRKPAF